MSYRLKRSPKVVFMLGPTATGKTQLAVEAALRYGGEIVNCDSVQMFQDVNIGTAKPTEDEMRGVPHHLLSHVRPGDAYTAGQFYQDALSVIDRRTRAGVKIFYVVGGSGFYAQALEKGLFPVETRDPAVRKSLEKEIEESGLETLFGELTSRDPGYAAKIGPKDQYRIVRALEILRAGKFKTLADVQKEFKTADHPFLTYKLGLYRRRIVLREAIETRTQMMFRRGLIEETESLRSQGLGAWGPLHSVGYKETQLYLDGKMTKEALVPSIVTSTMQLSKRQMTWFRRDPAMFWFDPDFSFEAPLKLIFELVRAEVSGS